MSLDVGPALLEALTAQPAITGLLGLLADGVNPSIHTKRPVPEQSGFPLIIVNPPAAIGDFDGLTARRAEVIVDVAIYGHQPTHYRDVETLGYLVRDLFHRERLSIAVSGCTVAGITAQGPRPAPTDDEKTVGRVVTVTIKLSRI